VLLVDKQSSGQPAGKTFAKFELECKPPVHRDLR